MNKEQFDQIAYLKRYNTLLAGVTTQEELETACRLLYNKLQRRDLNQLNGLVLEAICSFILTKILVVGMGPEAIKLAEALIERDIMPPIYYDEFQRLLSNQYDSLYGIKREVNKDAARHDKSIERQFRANLSVLLKTDPNPDAMIAKTIGYSFFSLSGDFIWADNNTLRLLELKSPWEKGINLFKLMIPFSVNFLYKKFGKELFKPNYKLGSQICFSFVIYSKQALGKYLKQLKKKKVKKVDEIREDSDGKGLYFKYLKALSCRATLVALKCHKDDLKGLQGNKAQENEGKVTPPKKITEIGPGTIETAKGVSENPEEESINLAVMLEMRIAKNIPDFDYKEMENDPIIMDFKDSVKKRLKDSE